MTQMLKLIQKDIKIVIITIFLRSLSMLSGDMEDIDKTKIKLLEMVQCVR